MRIATLTSQLNCKLRISLVKLYKLCNRRFSGVHVQLFCPLISGQTTSPKESIYFCKHGGNVDQNGQREKLFTLSPE